MTSGDRLHCGPAQGRHTPTTVTRKPQAIRILWLNRCASRRTPGILRVAAVQERTVATHNCGSRPAILDMSFRHPIRERARASLPQLELQLQSISMTSSEDIGRRFKPRLWLTGPEPILLSSPRENQRARTLDLCGQSCERVCRSSDPGGTTESHHPRAAARTAGSSARARVPS